MEVGFSMVYAVTYDLNATGQDYDALYRQIRSLGQTNHALQNLWLLSTTYTADQVRDHIRRVIDANDFVFVAQLYRGSYSAWMPVTSHDWIEGKL